MRTYVLVQDRDKSLHCSQVVPQMEAYIDVIKRNMRTYGHRVIAVYRPRLHPINDFCAVGICSVQDCRTVGRCLE